MKYILLVSLFALLFTSCQEADSITPVKQEEQTPAKANDDSTSTDEIGLLVTGEFTGESGHTTSGTAEIKQIDASTKSLVLSDFTTDNGPDLKFYLAEDTKAKNFLELQTEVSNGNKTIEIPNNTDITKMKYVLVWCKAFSVSFGHAELEKPE